MDEREERRRRRRRRRWLNPTRILLITVVAALVIVFGVSAKTIIDLWSEKGDLEKENKALKKEKAQLELELQKVNDLNYIEEQARKQLNMVKPGEVLYIKDKNKQDEEATDKSADDNR